MPTPLIKESDLSAMFLEHLKAIQIDEEVEEWLLTAIKEFDAQRRADHEQALASGNVLDSVSTSARLLGS